MERTSSSSIYLEDTREAYGKEWMVYSGFPMSICRALMIHYSLILHVIYDHNTSEKSDLMSYPDLVDVNTSEA